MTQRFVPITLGAPESTSLDVDGFRVTDARFAPGLVLTPHAHDRAAIAVLLDGSFDLTIAGRTYSCQPATAFTEPAEERHSNHIERAGAHVLVVQPDPSRDEWLRPLTSLTDSVHHFPHSPAARCAARIAHELSTPDSATLLAIESLVFEMIALLSRLERRQRDPAPPRWLVQAEEILRQKFRESVRVREIATAVGVHPVHLTRVFRSQFGVSLGTYVRKLRLDWSAEQLVTTRLPLSSIAYRAGFADQSHFTRLFKLHTGTTPDRYRRARGTG